MPAIINLEDKDIDIILEWYQSYMDIQGHLLPKRHKDTAKKLKLYKRALEILDKAFAKRKEIISE